MNKFQIGDVVTGPDDGTYSITTKEAVMTVVEIDYTKPRMLKVRVDKHPHAPHVGGEWWVTPSKMSLVKPRYSNNF